MAGWTGLEPAIRFSPRANFILAMKNMFKNLLKPIDMLCLLL
jgi:hypothetical protein